MADEHAVRATTLPGGMMIRLEDGLGGVVTVSAEVLRGVLVAAGRADLLPVPETPVTAVFDGTVSAPSGFLDVLSDAGIRLSHPELSPIRGLVGRRVRVTIEVLDG